jgi:hypothetical protein
MANCPKCDGVYLSESPQLHSCAGEAQRLRRELQSARAEIAGLREALQGCADRIKGGYIDAVSYHRALDAAESALRDDKP